LVERVEDILEEIAVFKALVQDGRTKRVPGEPPLPSGLSKGARVLLALLTLEPASIDALTRQSGLAPAEALRELVSLELAGLVRALPGKHYVRKEAYAQIAPHR
jgi:predicted Rossmann fold nucleotide-binding protein DprA/Smf involved in DNA uptake